MKKRKRFFVPAVLAVTILVAAMSMETASATAVAVARVDARAAWQKANGNCQSSVGIRRLSISITLYRVLVSGKVALVSAYASSPGDGTNYSTATVAKPTGARLQSRVICRFQNVASHQQPGDPYSRTDWSGVYTVPAP